jgi:hypothetical protein
MEVEIVERGRGPQLSTSRITVQDLVPYFQRHASNAEIREIIPILTDEEIGVIERYVREHHDAVMEQDRRIRERAEARRKPPELEEAERRERLKRLDAAREEIRRRKLERERAQEMPEMLKVAGQGVVSQIDALA